MRKVLGKPQNWQDFESLCKKLWGDIWNIQNKIKKNGRLGQAQSGVDVYGIPNGESEYWGIQCKGKDDYSQAKITEKEILTEVSNAQKFEPKLKVFIFACTSNKDVKTEQFVRIIDQENRSKGSFEVLLFCWEDIVDLIEENIDTYNWYQHGIGQIGRYDLTVWINNFKDYPTLKPTFVNQTTIFTKPEIKPDAITKENIMALFKSNEKTKSSIPIVDQLWGLNRINKSFVTFTIILENTGAMVIEDWKFMITFLEGIRHIDNGHPFIPKLSETTWVDNKAKSVYYRPQNNSPLIQKDNKHFEVSVLIEHDATNVKFDWEILARNFSRTNSFEIKVESKFVDETITKDLFQFEENRENKIEIVGIHFTNPLYKFHFPFQSFAR